MLHARFQDHRTSGSIDYKGFYHIWTWLPSWSCDHFWTIFINFLSPFPSRLHVIFDIDWPNGFREEDV